MMFIACPELTPGAPWPDTSKEGWPRKREELVGVVIQDVCANEEMVPFSSFAQTSWITTPTSSSRFLGHPSFEVSGQGAPGVSSGQAMNIIENLASEISGTTVAWAGQSYQERLSSGQ